MKNTEKANAKKMIKAKRNYGIYYAVSVMLIMAVIFTFAILKLILPSDVYSVDEKRPITQNPVFSVENLFNGGYTERYGEYYSDTFPYREALISLNSVLNESRGLRIEGMKFYNIPSNDDETDGGQASGNDGKAALDRYTEEEIYDAFMNRNRKVLACIASAAMPSETNLDGEKADDGNNGDGNGENNPGSNTELPKDDDPPVTEPNPGDGKDDIPDKAPGQNYDIDGQTGEKVNGVFVLGNVALELYGGSDKNGSRYAGLLNGFREKLPDSVKMYNLLVPTHCEFALPANLKNKAGNQKANIEHINSVLRNDIIKVNAYGALEGAAKNNEYLYFRSDHHWTQLGAFYAYQAFAGDAGFEPLAERDFSKRQIDNFLGTLYTAVNDAKIKKTPDYVEIFDAPGSYDVICTNKKGETYKGALIYKKASSSANSYGVFLGGDLPLITITNKNGANTGRSLVIIKESYGNAFAPLIVSHFDNVYVIDQRYFTSNLLNFISANSVTDILFINNMFAANGKARIDDMERLMGY